ncbi:unnamed protein product [Merluccius merluccius]
MVTRSVLVLQACGFILASVFGSQSASGSTGAAPPKPSVRCRCAGYPTQTLCLWSEPGGQATSTHYIATYRERKERAVVKDCLLVPPGSPSSPLKSSSSSEKLWLCQLDDLKLYTDYILNVTSVSPLANTTQLASFMVEDIVKPDPPVEVKVSPVGGLRKLAVEWAPPLTWSNLDIFPLKYQLRYSWSHRHGNHTMHLGPYESTRVVLGALARGRTYLIQVCAMELLGLGECSDWSSPVETMLTARRH